MASQNDEDPFLQVQQDVLAQLDHTRPLFKSYLRIRSLSTTASSPELAAARTDLESALASLAEDLADLVDSVSAIEDDPSQFGLAATEVTRRKRLVQDVGAEVASMRSELAKTLASSASPGGGGGDLPDPNAFNLGDDDDAYAEFEQQQQQEMMREQDTHLDGVFQTVGNLRRQADDMGRELEEQREMLDVVDTVADRVGGRLQTGVAKLQYVVRRNEDRLSSCCIGVLILVLCILLVLLLILRRLPNSQASRRRTQQPRVRLSRPCPETHT
ncbi:SNARE domain-containing protein [Verticillium dahliae VdLs.17]|uniref:t-SNARE affecting a late Golgi compartment protein 1 n=2 Tax=Verticillium dahliae TaxID=27337 RepID=G2WU77_VERDV|nr:SNARE domain-containing protein [Verticillium dahliae VdLs.17]EGY17668.1 SNARE domain-containing protein [Verticillium dahliae VdLs.17]